MDAAEAVDALKAAEALGATLLDAASAQHALSSKAAVQAQNDFLAQIDPAAKGKFAGPVNGQEAFKPTPGSRDIDAASPVETFGAPVVLMDSQAGINWATPASTVLFAGQQLHWTTQSDMHMTAAYTASSVSAEATSLYAHEGGIQAFAGNGPVSLQAHTDQLEILADREVTVISVNDGIEVKASRKIVLQAGQASITLEGRDITFACPGTFSVKGGTHVFDQGASGAAEFNGSSDQLVNLAPFPALYSQQINIAGMLEDDPELNGADYEIWTTGANGRLLARGNINADALSERVFTESAEEIEIIVGDNEWGRYVHAQELPDDENFSEDNPLI